MSVNTRMVPEKILVELKATILDYQKDALLPSQMKISDIRKGLLRLLRAKEKRFSKVQELSIDYNRERLPDEKTLAECGIWDGSILELQITTKTMFNRMAE